MCRVRDGSFASAGDGQGTITGTVDWTRELQAKHNHPQRQEALGIEFLNFLAGSGYDACQLREVCLDVGNVASLQALCPLKTCQRILEMPLCNIIII